MKFLDVLERRWSQIYGHGEPAPTPAQFECLRSYRIDDIRPSTTHCNVVFVLESPHTQEICYGYPLAGTSGEDVTDALSSVLRISNSDRGYSFGEILSGSLTERIGNLSRIGVINVSQLPMQKRVYPERIHSSFKPLLKNFETLRRPKAIDASNRPAALQIKKMLICDLQDRISCMPRDTYFAPLGKVASGYFDKANTPHPLQRSLLCVPHPSRRQWTRESNICVLRRLSNELQCKLGA